MSIKQLPYIYAHSAGIGFASLKAAGFPASCKGHMTSAQELDNQSSSRAELMRPFALKQDITMWCVKGNALLCEAARNV